MLGYVNNNDMIYDSLFYILRPHSSKASLDCIEIAPNILALEDYH